MAFLGYHKTKEVNTLISDALNAADKRKSIVSSLNTTQLDRAKAEIQNWRDALDEWEDEKQPSREKMAELYQEIIMDDAVGTHLDTITRRIEGTDYEIGKPTAEGFNADEDKTKLFYGPWFDEIIRLFLEAELMGYTLVEVLKPKPGAERYDPDAIVQIPRHMVIPEKMGVMKVAGNTQDLIDYEKFLPRLLQIGSKKDKGLFNRAAVLYIYKKNALAYWANFQSKFGIPPVIVKTDLSNKPKVDSLVNFLEDMRSNSFALTGFDDVIEVLNITNRDAYSTFKEMIKLIDEKIAKMMEGQTMTSDDGSSRSQAEVHQDTSDDWHLGRLRRFERFVNTNLLPILSADFGGFEGFEFKFKEIKDVDAIIDRVVKLYAAGYKVDAEWLSKATGLELTAIAEKVPGSDAESVMNAIDALYAELDAE